jgi:Spy/CpxP family protein refolding chaperone
MIFFILFFGVAACSEGGGFAGLDVASFGNQKELIGYYIGHREELGLSPEQVEKIKSIRENYRKAVATEEVDLKTAYENLADLLRENRVDLPKADETLREIGERATAVGMKYVRAVADAKKVLNPEQLTKARALLEK